EFRASLCKLGELAQAKVWIACKVVLQPSEMAGTEDDYHALVRRVGELHDVAVDAHVAPEPVGDQIGTGPIPGLADLRFSKVEAYVLGHLLVRVHVEQRLQDCMGGEIRIL